MVGLWLALLAFRLAALPAVEPPCEGGGDACPAAAIATSGGPSMLAISSTPLQQQALQEAVLAGDVAEPAGAATSGLIGMTATANLTSNYLSFLDVPYGQNSKQQADFYWPADVSMKPGSGWTAVIMLPAKDSSRKKWKGYCANYIVPSGRLCVAADYRRGAGDRDIDVAYMVNWLHQDASVWEIDVTNIVIGGTGLGGQVINDVLWDSQTGADLLQGSPPKVRAAMVLSGTKAGQPEKAGQAQNFPGATYICSSDTDTYFPYQYSEQLYQELDGLGKPVKFVNIPDSGHSIWNSPSSADWYAEILVFLDETVPGAATPTTTILHTTTTTTTTQPPTGCPYSQDLDVSYGSKSQQKVDVYWPQDVQLKPSGGWSAVIITPGEGSDRKGLKGFCTKYMVPSGRLCVAADYRQSDKERDGDMFNLAKWFYSNAATWDVDQTNIVLGGLSLGGLTINNVIWNKDKGKTLLSGSPAMIRAVLLLSGTWDGHKRQAKKAAYFPVSTYICSSDTDTTVPYKYSKNLWKELDKLGEPVKFVTFADAGHAIWYSDQKEDWYAEIVSFLDETVP